MYVSIKKQLISFQNFFSVLPLLYQGKNYRKFLILDVSVGNMTLCFEQHVAQVDQA
jgi:hypothetical protein